MCKLTYLSMTIILLYEWHCDVVQSKILLALQITVAHIPTNTRRSTNVGLLFAHRLRRRPNGKPTLIERLVFAGIGLTLCMCGCGLVDFIVAVSMVRAECFVYQCLYFQPDIHPRCPIHSSLSLVFFSQLSL